MSAPPPEQQPGKPVSRAAELAAEQVETIVEAAHATAKQWTESARQEAEAARQEAEQVRILAREAARTEVERARKEASERIAEAQEAADEVLAEAKAVSGGMRQLAHLLTTHAERILRDVQNSHRAISADLRAAGGGESPPGPPTGEPATERGAAERPRRAARGANPFDDLEPPSWVEERSAEPRRRRSR